MRRRFSKEEKLRAIERLEGGEAVGMNPKMVRRWREEWHRYGANAFLGYGRRRTSAPLKTEPVMFRVTPEEYARLSACVSSSEARTLSEFARRRLLDPEPSAREIEQKLTDLTAVVSRLARTIAEG